MKTFGISWWITLTALVLASSWLISPMDGWKEHLAVVFISITAVMIAGAIESWLDTRRRTGSGHSLKLVGRVAIPSLPRQVVLRIQVDERTNSYLVALEPS